MKLTPYRYTILSPSTLAFLALAAGFLLSNKRDLTGSSSKVVSRR